MVEAEPSAAQPHIVVFGNQIGTMIRFRGSLLSLLVANGVRVTTMCPGGSPDEEAELRSLGVDAILLEQVKRASINPLDDWRLLREIESSLRALKPTHMFSYFLKPAIYGTLAARGAGVPRRIAMIEGLGFSQSEAGGIKRRVARAAVTLLLRRSLRVADSVIVLNADDRAYLTDVAGVPEVKIVRIDGIGVDVAEYAIAPLPAGPVTFTLAARLIREKGVADFAEAARRVKARAPAVRFVLLGGLDDGPTAVLAEEVAQWEREGILEWKGQVGDVRPYLRETSVFVLPSYYGEGLPRSVMEAMAMGRPVITSTGTGCRDSITHGVSGFTVEARRPDLLADAMLQFVNEPALLRSMGAAAGEEARRRYDSRKQDRVIMDLLLG